MSGHCDFCQIWHSGGCRHPGHAILREARRHGYVLAMNLLQSPAYHSADDEAVAAVDFFLPKKGDPTP